MFAFAWARILDRVASSVAELAARSPTGRVTLVGHSSGGIMLRLFLDDAPFQGRRYNGKALADTLVMLRQPPHRAQGHGAAPDGAAAPAGISLRRSGSFYVSVAGDLDLRGATPMAQRLDPPPTATAAAMQTIAVMAWCLCPQLCWRAPRHWCCRG